MRVAEILGAFPRKSALVVGDICLDRWCTYDPNSAEASRETGIPRIGVVATEVTPGGGGTIACNLVALGVGRVAVLGVLGEDGHGYELRHALKAKSISSELLIGSDELSTFTYTKLINAATGVEDQPRVDFINTRPLPWAIERQIVAGLRDNAKIFDVIFVSDQAETEQGGVVTTAVREMLTKIAPGRVIVADSRRRAAEFRNVILKPNAQEAACASTSLFGCIDYQRLRKYVSAPLLFVTQGPQGVVVVEDGRETQVPTRSIQKPVDICGAGDSFAAGAGMALVVNGSAVEAAIFGNLVASVTILKPGTGTASPAEVEAAADE
jgi:rfaE bifunctional protein kinase chain/domain